MGVHMASERIPTVDSALPHRDYAYIEYDSGLRSIACAEDVIRYLSTSLGWEIGIDDFEDIDDISYDFEAADIGLKEEAFSKVLSLRQLQPLVDGQRWGVFCVEFESGKLEVTALRKILSGLVPKRRNAAEHAVWEQEDLLFICLWGHGRERTIGFAHFEDKSRGLPQIKIFSCAPASEDFTQLKVFSERLAKLRWPSNPADLDSWGKVWSGAFETGYRQTIHDSSTLTIQLAKEARGIRDRVLEVMGVETANGYVHLLYDKFRDTLIHDMTEEQFADMYAQTVVYGLFSARCMDSTQGDFSADEAIECIPSTNPFLKSLMRECLGSAGSSVLSFDELEIGNVTDLLLHADTESIISDFNRQTGGGREDPVIHFYEEFLTAYDKTQKVERGVFYTPQPVVNFIVRAVDHILKEQFGLADGLASEETKTIKVKRQSRRKIDGAYRMVDDTAEVPAVQVLDPATGTGTFIRQTILQIYKNFREAHAELDATAMHEAWNEYVPKHLLPRLNAFELMMAPYAVAHMKLAMVLKDTGYEFGSDSRLHVYLTNSLEKPGKSDYQGTLFDDPLALESIEANIAKKNNGINVVIGNPPYSGESANNGQWIRDLISDYKMEPGGTQKLGEQNSKWLNDDYVKFIRYAQRFIDGSELGILAFINPHGFIDNPTFRGMRWRLLQTFSSIYVFDLHGNTKRRETCPDGSKDENVFDIQQGTCIFIAVKGKGAKRNGCQAWHADLYGSREHKYDVLESSRFCDIEWKEVFPQGNDYLFVGREMTLKNEWDASFGIDEAFPLNGVGICSKRDTIAYHDDRSCLIEVLEDFAGLSEDALKSKYHVTKESRDQKVSYAKSNISSYGIRDEYIRRCLYRPFDLKWTYYTDKVRGFLAYPVYKVLSHMLYPNIGLITSRQGQASDINNWNVVFCTDDLVDLNVFRRGGGCLFPLYLYNETLGGLEKTLNIDGGIISNFSAKLGIPFNSNSDNTDANAFDAEDFLSYIYAVLHAKCYRARYRDFLKLEFPRIPYPCDQDFFWSMVDFGRKLMSLHLMREKADDSTAVELTDGSNTIEKISYKNGSVYISKTQCFMGVSHEAWTFQVGGYQPLEKYLKDRKGCVLTDEAVHHYCCMVNWIERTIKLMEQIDFVAGPEICK